MLRGPGRRRGPAPAGRHGPPPRRRWRAPRPRPARRFGVVYVPQRHRAMEYWTPAEEGPRVRDHADPPPARAVPGTSSRWSRASGAYWTPAHAGASTTFLDRRGGVSPARRHRWPASRWTQLLAREYGRHTELASLQLAIDSRANAGQCSGNHSCVYTNTICWRSRTTPLPMENNPPRGLRADVRRQREHGPGRPPRPHGARPVDPGFRDRKGRRPQARGGGRPTASRSTSTSRASATSSGASSGPSSGRTSTCRSWPSPRAFPPPSPSTSS